MEPLYGMPAPIRQEYLTDPRTIWARQLQQQGASTAPVQSWVEGLARMLQAPLGGWEARKSRDEYKGRSDAWRSKMAQALAEPDDEKRASILGEVDPELGLGLLNDAPRRQLQRAQTDQVRSDMEAERAWRGPSAMPQPGPQSGPQLGMTVNPKGAPYANVGSPDLFAAQERAESGSLGAAAVSPKGAIGNMQLMPATAANPGYGVAPFKAGLPLNDVTENRRVGQDYSKAMIAKYGDIPTALMAYNWGPGNVDKWIAGGRNPAQVPAETRAYVSKIMGSLGQGQPGQQFAQAQPQTMTDAQPGGLFEGVPPEIEALARSQGRKEGLATIAKWRSDNRVMNPAQVAQQQAIRRDPNEHNFKNANILRDEFNSLTKDYRTVQDAFAKIKATAEKPSGAGDMSLLYSYVKILDPGSVVRESEFAMAAASGSLGERVQGAVQRILNGERLPDSLRADFIREAENIYKTQQRSYDQVKSQYKTIAERAGLKPEDFIPDYIRQDLQAAPTGAPVPTTVARPVAQPGELGRVSVDESKSKFERMALPDLAKIDPRTLSGQDLEDWRKAAMGIR